MDSAVPSPTESTPATEPRLDPLAFIHLSDVSKDAFRGGILVTDSRGKPLEFRCTSAIQPTAVQKTLYGDTLRAHMCVELVARPLLATLKEKPKAVVVTQEEFIELRGHWQAPLLLIARQGAEVASADDRDRPQKSESLASPSGRFEPITVACHWSHPGDVGGAIGDLGAMFARFDLMEPFARIGRALALLHEKGVVSNS